MTAAEEPTPSDKVGFRDIYRAVGESETRIKEHVSLALLPIANTLADHEARIRLVEGRMDGYDLHVGANAAAGIERRRIGGLTVKTVGLIVLVTNFIIGTAVVIVNILAGNPA